jgi:hypothetical protein
MPCWAATLLRHLPKKVKGGKIHAAHVVKPKVLRHIALAMARTGEVTLAMRTVMQEAQSVAKRLTLR